MTACTSTCSGTCLSSCGVACSSSCSSTCIGGCRTTCSGSCTDGCKTTCLTSCSSTFSGGSSHHLSGITQEQIAKDIKREVIDSKLIDSQTKIYVNPTGQFIVGGPQADSGLTGRKIIVDTYGGYASHGGGAFSGKDPTKVDRSAAYMARYVAKNIVAADLADKCEIELAYAIGVVDPISVFVETFGTSRYTDEQIVEIIQDTFDLSPIGIIEKLHLREPIYSKTAAYGHFGRTDIDLPWERIDMADLIRRKYL